MGLLSLQNEEQWLRSKGECPHGDVFVFLQRDASLRTVTLHGNDGELLPEQDGQG